MDPRQPNQQAGGIAGVCGVIMFFVVVLIFLGVVIFLIMNSDNVTVTSGSGYRSHGRIGHNRF